MITSLTIKNFKRIGTETYTFTDFDLLVGRNNSGKSTILQALAIWQFCIDEFRRNKKTVKTRTGIEIVLPNFTPLPVPRFILLWHKQTERKNVKNKDGKLKPEYIFIEVEVTWRTKENEIKTFTVGIRYDSKQSVYVSPREGWDIFTEFDEANIFPTIMYVPPYSGLDDNEERKDMTVIKKYVGRFQSGNVLRNILLRVFSEEGDSTKQTESDVKNWKELTRLIKKLFSVELINPKYNPATDTLITCEYKQDGDTKKYDLISGGTGFHQTLILLSFIYGFHPDMILFDEPDAHLHTNLQKEILDYFKELSEKRNIQFIIATHSEEFINGVNATQIVSLLKGKPERIVAKPKIITALADVFNIEITQLQSSPFILYVEGEADERILRAWAKTIEKTDALSKFYVKAMGGGTKEEMKKKSEKHFEGISEIISNVKKIVLFDYDTEESYHPQKDNPALYEWQRKNIENYLFVSSAWRRAALFKMQEKAETLLNQSIIKIIDDFFVKQRLTISSNETWRTVDADVFYILDGKKLLFENATALFQQLRNKDERLVLNRETIASQMVELELHQDILDFFEKLELATSK
jgi:AAA15 family ATPase/GTPase